MLRSNKAAASVTRPYGGSGYLEKSWVGDTPLRRNA
jgi:hypothetical protein